MKAKRAEYGTDDPNVAYIPSPLAPASEREYAASPGAQTRTGTMAPEAQSLESDLPPPANEPLAYGCLVVGRDTHVTGSLSVPGTLRVEGRIDGEIEAGEIIVLSGGTIVGNVACDVGTIHGTLSGTLRCREQLVVMADATLEGDLVYHKDLRAEAGARLNCTLSYRSDPAPAPIHRVVTLEREEVRHAEEHTSQRASLMTRLFGAEKHPRG